MSRGKICQHLVRKVLVRQVIGAVRDYNFSNVLFRNTIVEKLGVNITDWECLGLLLQKGVSTPTELSKHTGLTSGATTAMLDRLERSGIIERRRNPEDRRGTLIVIDKEKAAETRCNIGICKKSTRTAFFKLHRERIGISIGLYQ